MFAGWPLLSCLIWTPILGGAVVLMLGEKSARRVALLVSLLTLALCVPLYQGFELTTGEMQLTESMIWIPAFGINYLLGIDGIALPLVILTAFITPLVVLSAWRVIEFKPAQYLAAFLFMEGLMIGVFCAMDGILFYVFWEAMLIPMFLIIGIWGGPNRVYATIKFFLYTFLGSVFMLVALVYMSFGAAGFAIADFHALPLTRLEQLWIFIAFLLAFAVKIPMWPVHTWLPDAHVEAPTGGSAVLAAIMLKMGGYGFLRFSLPITPDASRELDWLLIALSLIAVVYIALVALVQEDMKKLIAYSSISHMGFVTLGLFIVFTLLQDNPGVEASGAVMGVEGAIVQMISHGFVSAALFICVGVLYDRVHSRMIKDYGGVANTMPMFAVFAVFFAMSNAGLPGTSGFVGEILVILASFKANFWYAFVAATTLVLGAAYTLWMVKRVIYGEVANKQVAELQDLEVRETVVLAALAVAVLALGVWPYPWLEVMHPSVDKLLAHIAVSKL